MKGQARLRKAAYCPRYSTPRLPLHVLYQPNRYLAAKVRVLVDFLVERFAGGRWY